MRTKKNRVLFTAGSYDLSVSDLMSALCAFFLIFLVFIISSYSKETNKLREDLNSISRWDVKVEDLFNEINRNILDEQKKNWGISVLEPKDNNGAVLIRFGDDKIAFDGDSIYLKDEFKTALDVIFPIIVKTIIKDEYRDNILEVRIEGHSANETGKSLEENWKEGVYYSTYRTKNVLEYCTERSKLEKSLKDLTISIEEDPVAWLQERIVAIGYSNTKPIKNAITGQIDNDHSRRVDISIRTNVEKLKDEIIQVGESKNIKGE